MTNKEYRADLKAHQACIQCRKQDGHTRAGFVLCYECSFKATERASAYYHKNIDKMKAYQAQYRQKKREERMKSQ